MRETEFKFTPPASFALPEFGDSSNVAVVEKRAVQNLRAIYYDTPDLRLHRFGATLRQRTGEQDHAVWTLKLPLPDEEPTAREEINSDSAERTPPVEILDLATAFIRSDKVVPVATLKTKRQRWTLRDGSGLEIAELVDDDVSVVEGKKVIGRFRELEIEQKNGTSKQMKKIADALRKAGAIDAKPIPKASRALALRGKPSPENTSEDDAPDTVAGTLRRYVQKQVRLLVLNDPVVRLGKNSEGVHQMRVATRRIRSNLKTFDAFIDETWKNEITMDLKWLADLLGDVRDLDVMQERFYREASDIEGLKPLFDSLTRQHRRARSRLLEGMRSDRYRLLIESLSGGRMPVDESSSASARASMGAVVSTMWSALASEARTLMDGATDERLHDLRIQAKRLRYAVEAVATSFAEERRVVQRFGHALADLQDVLGKNQDATVAQATLTAVATRGSKDALFCIAVGRLIERETQGLQRTRAMFSEAWGKLDRKKNLTWLPG